MNKKYLIGIPIVLVISFVTYFLYAGLTAPGDYNALATCLTEKGFVMAGTNWCHFCAEQKELFGNSFRLINYKDCDEEKSWCDSHGVTGYPTWVDSEGNTYSGRKSLETLAGLSGCGF